MKTIDVGPSDKFEPATKTPRELRNGGLRGSKVSKASSWSLVMITPYGIRNTEQLRSTFVTIDLQRFFKPVSSGTKCGYQLWFQWLWAGLSNAFSAETPNGVRPIGGFAPTLPRIDSYLICSFRKGSTCAQERRILLHAPPQTPNSKG
ncbi:hypothetical protein CIHG_01181 [Coccidioides immitis H538.4]|uniref:Uncharacterized protein n=2 Tax=Coccidioides immitis TaxID=5501 RepID=A0A0J8U8K6_COCIT|nr:hypothetical protein CIRG_01030 [Coccidioides immitis RMSCC 2394]KMU83398.1 hypothetical protein CIHG_01181 [Coccidioides immitis H538.4]